jgi:ABC-2 type transport system ATP-binding protein
VLEAILKVSGENNSLLLSSHMIRDMETALDEIIFLDNGKVVLAGNADQLRAERGLSIEELYREVYGDA